MDLKVQCLSSAAQFVPSVKADLSESVLLVCNSAKILYNMLHSSVSVPSYRV